MSDILAVVTDDPNGRLSNFMLGLMVVHFLQTRSTPILPTLQSLDHLSGN